MVEPHDIPTTGGRSIAGHLFGEAGPMVVVNPAMAVPGRFYHRFAAHLSEAGFRTLVYDYRDIGASRTGPLAGSQTTMLDWVDDLAAAVAWAGRRSDAIHLVGHSLGGQLAGTLPDPGAVASMVAVVAQSGHWRHQGGRQPVAVFLHGHVTLPVLSRLPYAPFRLVGMGEDVPRLVARRWGRWSRHPDYLFGDPEMPLHRYRDFTAPVLAYSIEDDDWGTPEAVDAMMRRYPHVERRHLVAADHGMASIGHLGAFRPGAESIWDEIVEWLRGHS